MIEVELGAAKQAVRAEIELRLPVLRRGETSIWNPAAKVRLPMT